MTLMNRSPLGSSVHGILQARILEWDAAPSSRGSSQPGDQTHVSCGSRTVGRFFTAEPPRKPNSIIYIYTLSQILFPFRLQNIESSSLCYTVGPCWLSILYIVVCVYVNPRLPICHLDRLKLRRVSSH